MRILRTGLYCAWEREERPLGEGGMDSENSLLVSRRDYREWKMGVSCAGAVRSWHLGVLVCVAGCSYPRVE